MNDKYDIEKILGRFRAGPGERVKRSVMARYAQHTGEAGTAQTDAPVWKRPVPFYLAAAAVVAALLIALPVQRALIAPAGPEKRPGRTEVTGPAGDTAEALDLEWTVAENDLI